MIYDGTHSITFIALDSFRGNRQNQRNTWMDWHLVPNEKPVVAVPKRQTNIIEIPGTNARVDLSDALFGYLTYSYRSGSFKFIVDPDCGKTSDEIREMVSSFLTGKEMVMILEDDPLYYYRGSISVSDWPAGKNYSTITFNYELYPYKRTIYPTWFRITSAGSKSVFVKSGSEPIVPVIKLSSEEADTITVHSMDIPGGEGSRRLPTAAGVFAYKFDDEAQLTRISKIIFTDFVYPESNYKTDAYRYNPALEFMRWIFDLNDDEISEIDTSSGSEVIQPPTKITFYKNKRAVGPVEYDVPQNFIDWAVTTDSPALWLLTALRQSQEFYPEGRAPSDREIQVFPQGTTITIRYNGANGPTEDIIADGKNHYFALNAYKTDPTIDSVYSVTIDQYTIEGDSVSYYSEFFTEKEYSGTNYKNVVQLKHVTSGSWDGATIVGAVSSACLYKDKIYNLAEGLNYFPEMILDKQGAELTFIGNGLVDLIFENGEI